MNSAARKIDHSPSAKADVLVVFLARAEARASLVAAGLHTVQESVDVLWAAAERDGLVDKFGADAVQQLLGEAFARWRLRDG
jgi:hypothetical protein